MLWCNGDDVRARTIGQPADNACRPFIESASGLLFLLSGRSIAPTRDVSPKLVPNAHGRVSLINWTPVRRVDVVTRVMDDQPVPFTLSPQKTYLTIPRSLRGVTVRVSMTIGSGIPSIAKHAAAALAAEMVKSSPAYVAGESKDARTDPRLTSMSRQGTSWSFADVTDSIKEGLTGVREVDMFLKAVNPGGLRNQPKVVAP